jgi:hypothetical protein
MHSLEQPTHYQSTYVPRPIDHNLCTPLSNPPTIRAPMYHAPEQPTHSQHNLRTRSATNSLKFPQKTQQLHNIGPPPHMSHVDPRANSQKRSKLNSSHQILFVKQRRTAKFPQNIVLHLVTLFPVELRVLPFSELSPKNSKPQIFLKFLQLTQKLAYSRSPIIKGRRTVLFYLSPVICNLHF